MGPLHRRDLRGRARGHHLAAAVPALGPQVDDVVGALDDLGVVFDDHHRVALVDELLQGGEQPADIVEVETGGGFVEDEERSGPGRPGDVRGQLETLGFPAGKGGDGLAQTEVVEPHPGQRPQPAHDLRLVPEELHGLGDGEAEHVVDVLVAVGDLQDLLAVAGAAALRAGGEDVREELHLDPLEPLAAAGLAASAFHVEREGGGGVAPEPRQVHASEQAPDGVERLHVGHRVRPGRGAQRRLVHEDHLGDPVDAANLVAVRQGRQRRGLEAPDVAGDDLVHQARLARPGHAGDAHQPAQGDAHVDVLEVVGVGAAYLQGASLYPGPVTDRPRDDLPLGQVVGGEGCLAFQQLVIGAGEHHLAAVLTCPRTQVDDVVALLDDLRVVLHHHHGVVVGSEAVKNLHQAVAVPRMKADGRLVQHVQRVHQGRADGGGQVHPLELAPGQRPGLAVEGQVLQAHAHEIIQAPADLVEHQTRDLIVALLELQRLKVGVGVGYAHAADVRDVAPGDPEVQALGLEPGPLAIGAGHVTPVAGQEHADVHLVALPLQPLEPAADTVILPVLPASFAVDDQPAVLFVQLGEGAVQRDAPAPAELLELPHLPARNPGGPRLDDAVGDGLGRVRDHQVEVEVDGAAESVAGLAGPQRAVEGKEIGLRLGVGQAAGGAVEAVAEALPAPAVLHVVEVQPPLAELKGLLQGVRDPLTCGLAVRETVDHDVGDLPGRGVERFQFHQAAVPQEPVESRLQQSSPDVFPWQRRRHGHRKGQDPPHPLTPGLELPHDGWGAVLGDDLVAAGAVKDADLGEQQLQVVVQLGHGADRRPGGLHRAGLVDGDGGRDVLDGVDVRLLHAIEKLPGVRREALDVPALTFRVEDVEGDGGLARPADAGHHRQRVEGDLEIEVLEIILLGAADVYPALIHGG